MKKLTFPLYIIMVSLLLPACSFAEGAGLRANVKGFELYIQYNDNGRDRISGMDYVRNPGGLLFDVISLLQANANQISKTGAEYVIEIGNINKYISINKNKPTEETIFYIEKIETLDQTLFKNELCKVITGKKCNKIPEQVTLYISDQKLYSDLSDLIEFGCFPCSNKRTIAISDRFISSDKVATPPKFDKTMVTRKTIGRYFKRLRY